MSVRNNPNIVCIRGTVKEINSRSFFGRKGLDDIYHYAYLIIEDANGELINFEHVTTNEKIAPEVDAGRRQRLHHWGAGDTRARGAAQEIRLRRRWRLHFDLGKGAEERPAGVISIHST